MIGSVWPSRLRCPRKCCRFSWPNEDDGAAVIRYLGPSGEVVGVAEVVSPLRLEHVGDVQVLARGLEHGTVTGQEVHVGVAAVPAAGVHVGPAADAQLQLALAPA